MQPVVLVAGLLFLLLLAVIEVTHQQGRAVDQKIGDDINHFFVPAVLQCFKITYIITEKGGGVKRERIFYGSGAGTG